MQNGRDITLILGGASSGKSAWAESYVLGQAQKVGYLATAQAFDAEMKSQIEGYGQRVATGQAGGGPFGLGDILHAAVASTMDTKKLEITLLM